MTAVCASCQASLEPGALEGLCPRCLLVRALPLERAGDVPTTAAAPFVPPSPAELAPLFPQLEILQLLGQGGMGAVYKARQVKLDRVVALKILPPAAAKGPGFAERFAREARALAKLNHPHIVAVHDFGDVEGLYYLVMEFVEGVNLRQSLGVGRLEPRQALALVAELCSALQYAHEMGVVHRDIKPENVLLDRQGRVKVADFGLAKLVGPGPAQGRLTGTLQAMGTPHYMAPEQWERPREVDHRADIYSLGVVFYELLTGELPLGRFAPPSEKTGADPRLDQVVLRAMEKEPAQRYQQMSEMKSAVESVEAEPEGAAEGEVEEEEDEQAPAPEPLNWSFEAWVTLGMVAALGAAGAGVALAQPHLDKFKLQGVSLVVLALLVVSFYPWGRYLKRLASLAVLGIVLSWLWCDLAGLPHPIGWPGNLFLYAVGLAIALVEVGRLASTFRPGDGEVEEEEGKGEYLPPVVGLTPQEERVYGLLADAYSADRFYSQLSILPYLDGELLAAMRESCDVPADDRVLGVIDFSGGDGQSGIVFGGRGLYWCDGPDTPYPGQDALPYAELVKRRLVNHGNAVYLGNDQFVCPDEENSSVSGEHLAAFLYELRERVTAEEGGAPA